MLDEPSAALDIEQRVALSKILKRFFVHNDKTGFIIEHDIMVATTISMQTNCKIILLEEIKAGKNRVSVAHSSKPFNKGMNSFLKMMNITFSKTKKNNRSRINKYGSAKDKEQKKMEKYYQ